MASSPDLIRRPDIWQAQIKDRLDRLHRAATDAEDAYVGAETRDDVRARRQARRRERLTEQYGLQR
jgi:hypothetical protein